MLFFARASNRVILATNKRYCWKERGRGMGKGKGMEKGKGKGFFDIVTQSIMLGDLTTRMNLLSRGLYTNLATAG